MQQLSTISKTLVLTGFSALSLWTAPVQAASFRSFLGYVSVTALSADGSVLVGSDLEAFRWTQADGLVRLGFLTNNYYKYLGKIICTQRSLYSKASRLV